MTQCLCPCHIGSVEALWVAPDVRDPVAAVTACGRCVNAHCPALLSDEPPSRPWPKIHTQADGTRYYEADEGEE